ncbi:hypothetical protein WA026_013026 [Henosepilachna vigintioctopunctata]|uniref:Uncharacterized protein n=1 Tax=Henosepilachna vigintioctopunctata TaxID=420089 RepID=A0AAW1UKW0_9CUCU
MNFLNLWIIHILIQLLSEGGEIVETILKTKNTSTSESSERLPPALAVSLPSTSFGVVTPREVRPTPKIVGKRTSARRIRRDISVLTSTPYKKYLEVEVNKKTDIEQKKALKEAKKIKKCDQQTER